MVGKRDVETSRENSREGTLLLERDHSWHGRLLEPTRDKDGEVTWHGRLQAYTMLVLIGLITDFVHTTLRTGTVYRFQFYTDGVTNFFADASSFDNLCDLFSIGHFCWGIALGRLFLDFPTVLMWHIFWEMNENAGGGEAHEPLVNAVADCLFTSWGCLVALYCFKRFHPGMIIISETLNQTVAGIGFIIYRMRGGEGFGGQDCSDRSLPSTSLCVNVFSIPFVITAATWFLNCLHGQPYVVAYVFTTTCLTSAGWILISEMWGPQCSVQMRALYASQWFDVSMVLLVAVPMALSCMVYNVLCANDTSTTWTTVHPHMCCPHEDIDSEEDAELLANPVLREVLGE